KPLPCWPLPFSRWLGPTPLAPRPLLLPLPSSDRGHAAYPERATHAGAGDPQPPSRVNRQTDRAHVRFGSWSLSNSGRGVKLSVTILAGCRGSLGGRGLRRSSRRWWTPVTPGGGRSELSPFTRFGPAGAAD